MKGIKEITKFEAVLENPLGFIDSTDSKEIINQIPNLFKEIAKVLFKRYDI